MKNNVFDRNHMFMVFVMKQVKPHKNSIKPSTIWRFWILTSAKYSVGADILSSASVYSEADSRLKSSFDAEDAIGITEFGDTLTFIVLLPFVSSIMMTCNRKQPTELIEKVLLKTIQVWKIDDDTRKLISNQIDWRIWYNFC